MSETHWMAYDRHRVQPRAHDANVGAQTGADASGRATAPEAGSLEAHAVGYAYNAHDPVLTEVTAHIVPGSFLAILGMNGCGKSTLLACLDDMLRPKWGKVLLAGRELSAYAREERARHIALVAQHTHANGVTVYDALLLGRKPYVKAAPSADDYEVVNRVISELGLEHLALRYLDELSGGEHQKVVIARALVQDTDVLLLDEPTNNLDMANQVEVMELVRHIAREHGVACAAVLHDINLALRYCDRFLVIKDGTVLAYGGIEVMTQEVIEAAYNTRVEIIEYESAPNATAGNNSAHKDYTGADCTGTDCVSEDAAHHSTTQRTITRLVIPLARIDAPQNNIPSLSKENA